MPSRSLPGVFVLLLVAACVAERTPATPEPTLTREVVVNRRLSAAEVDSIRARGTTVDTIIVAPDVITLRVGELFNHMDLRVRALDAAGAPIPGFSPVWIVPRSEASSRVYRFEALGLRGLAAGEGILYVEALPRTTPRPTRPSTAVRVVVRP